MVNDMATCDECNGWLNPALAVDAAVRRGEEILLIQRKFPPMAGYWALPGGFVERDEDPLHAVLRELEEETGLTGSNPELLMVMGKKLAILWSVSQKHYLLDKVLYSRRQIKLLMQWLKLPKR